MFKFYLLYCFILHFKLFMAWKQVSTCLKSKTWEEGEEDEEEEEDGDGEKALIDLTAEPKVKRGFATGFTLKIPSLVYLTYLFSTETSNWTPLTVYDVLGKIVRAEITRDTEIVTRCSWVRLRIRLARWRRTRCPIDDDFQRTDGTWIIRRIKNPF